MNLNIQDEILIQNFGMVYILELFYMDELVLFNRQGQCHTIKLWLEREKNEVKNAVGSATAKLCKAAYFALRNSKGRNSPLFCLLSYFRNGIGKFSGSYFKQRSTCLLQYGKLPLNIQNGFVQFLIYMEAYLPFKNFDFQDTQNESCVL